MPLASSAKDTLEWLAEAVILVLSCGLPELRGERLLLAIDGFFRVLVAWHFLPLLLSARAAAARSVDCVLLNDCQLMWSSLFGWRRIVRWVVLSSCGRYAPRLLY